ncbi:MAG: FAD-binding oxidoreductase [Clostridiales Family XIII bacterium]|jgi:FAD/FMN-containing dehydrogenase|nr:FAD-binding oxidoreductase [Clostridiales Family XIII bacterium]
MKEKAVIIKELKALFGSKIVTEEDILKEQSSDWIGYRRWERHNGSYLAGLPTCVIKADSTEDVSEAIKYCYDNEIVVVPQCGRSCVCAGVETYEGTVVLDGSDMNGIVELDEENFMLTAKCGTPLEYIEKYLNERGYTSGHFPQSLPLAQLGGLVSTRSIGQLSTLYGGIEDLLHGMEAVLCDGSVIRIKNVPRRAAGPELNQLFMGSEGNFGFVTEATIKIFKHRADRAKQSYAVKDFETGIRAIKEIMQEGYKPAVVRLHDDVEAEMSYGSFIEESEHILLFVSEGPDSVIKATAEGIDAIMSKYESRSLGEKPVDLWYTIRNATCDDLYAHNKKGLLRDTCEISGNWSCIMPIYENALRRFKEEIENLTQISAHSSHSYMTGTNLYFVFSFKGDADLAKSRAQYDTAMRIIMEETLKYGGSICHHHGVGKYRTPYMPAEHGTSYPMMETLKKAFDPKNIMNTGAFLPR